MSRRVDGVVTIARESTRLVDVQRQRRDGVRATQVAKNRQRRKLLYMYCERVIYYEPIS